MAEGQTYVTVAGAEGEYHTAVVSDPSQILSGQALTTLQNDAGQETIIIVQSADGTENATHAIVDQDGTVQYIMQQPDQAQPAGGEQVFTEIQQQQKDPSNSTIFCWCLCVVCMKMMNISLQDI